MGTRMSSLFASVAIGACPSTDRQDPDFQHVSGSDDDQGPMAGNAADSPEAGR